MPLVVPCERDSTRAYASATCWKQSSSSEESRDASRSRSRPLRVRLLSGVVSSPLRGLASRATPALLWRRWRTRAYTQSPNLSHAVWSSRPDDTAAAVKHANDGAELPAGTHRECCSACLRCTVCGAKYRLVRRQGSAMPCACSACIGALLQARCARAGSLGHQRRCGVCAPAGVASSPRKLTAGRPVSGVGSAGAPAAPAVAVPSRSLNAGAVSTGASAGAETS
jgi:hypothetical protein